MRRLLLLLSAVLLFLPNATPAAAGVPEALDWLRAHQASDGGFAGDFDDSSSLSATMEAVFAIVAAGEDPAGWTQDGNTPISFMESRAGDALRTPGDTAKLILAVVAAGLDPRDFGDLDLVGSLEESFAGDRYGGAEAGNVFAQSLAILALRAAERPIPPGAVDWLVGVQIEDGSWSWNGDTTPGSGDSNSTALAVQALRAAGGRESAVDEALDYLQGIQNEDGGFPYQKPSEVGTDTDANSTAYVIQALLATGNDPSSDAWAQGGNTPVEALSALQQEDGAFAWQAAVPGENYLATAQAAPALAGASFLDLAGVADAGQAPAPEQLPASGGAGGWGSVAVAGLGAALAALGLALRRRR
jgi:hypothetical protein